MTKIIPRLESDNISANLEDKSTSKDGNDRSELSLSNMSDIVSFPSSESLTSSTNLNDNIIREISVTNKMTSFQEEGKIIDNSEVNEIKTRNSTDEYADSINDKSSSSQKESYEKINDYGDANDPKINKGDDKILDSEEDEDIYASFKPKKKNSKPNTRKLLTIVDSDSDDENIFTSKHQNEGETESFFHLQKPNNLKKLVVVNSDSEDNNTIGESSEDENNESRERKETIQKSKKMTNVIKDLIDSDDSEPDYRNIHDRALSVASDENRMEGKTQRKAEKKRKGSVRASKDAAMQQIHSESQRLLRESEVSLPYHRPKQRTLQEFLNRKKISLSLPEAATTAAKVKMFGDLISKAIEEKEKEAELFYKSSDSEEEIQLPSEHSDRINKSQDSSNQNVDIREPDKLQMDVDGPSNKNEGQLYSASLDVADTLPFNNLNSAEQNDQVAQSQDTIDKTEETHMKCNVDKNNSIVSRKLFVSAIENEDNSETPNQESQKESSIQQVENSNDGKESKDSSVMETNTNDFELRFSTNNFDTNLNLIEFENNCRETVSSPKTVGNKKSEIGDIEINETSGIVEEGKNMADEGLMSAISKGHVLGLPLPDFDDIIEKKSLKKKIPSCFLNVKPTLQGSPGTTIELSENVKTNHEGIKKLVDRFVRHSNVHKSEENSDVTVVHTEVTPNGLKIVEQVLPYKIPNNTEESELHKPGAKLQKLKEELQQKISSKRNKEWLQKEEASKALDEYLGHEIDNEDEGNLLPNEEEELDDESAESEPEENDVLIKENKKSKCAFADDEAEVSDDNDDNQVDEDDEEEEDENNLSEEDEREDEEDEHEDEEDEREEEEDEREDEEDEREDEEDEQENGNEHPKKLRRITTAFEDDSNLSAPSNSENELKEITKKKFQRTKTDVDMFDNGSDGWISDVENEIRPTMVESTNSVCQTPLVTTNHLSLMSPITQLTALNKCLSSTKKISTSKESNSLDQLNDSFSQESISAETRLQGSLNLDKWCGLKKNLFQDCPDAVNDEELMDICSGSFNETPQVNKIFKPLMDPPSQMKVTESQLMDLCSGSFSSHPIDENSQDIKLTFDEKSRSPMKYSPKKMVEVKSLSSRLKVVSSDEEDEIMNEEDKKKNKKKKVTKLILSDDEEDEQKQEESDLSEEEDENEQEEDEEKFVDYDSEENEVVVIPKKDIKKVAAKYVDAEAELSGSDWDSADEDERELDKLEREEGDDDEIDENQMRNQLGKIHARQMLDDDQREVRLLQDMLFEDGDLHSEGAGRERKFRWKNIDKLSNEWINSKTSEDPDMIVDAFEDANELKLRKLRYEQQKFFEKQKKDSTDDIEEDLNDSPIFKIGLKIVNTVKSRFSQTEESLPNKLKKPLASSLISDLLEKPANFTSSTIHRGSFLARGEEALARIASMIGEKDKVICAPLNSRRFVFEHISPSVKDVEETETYEEPSTSNKRARKRTSTFGSTPKSAKKMKVDEKLSAGKKLFN